MLHSPVGDAPSSDRESEFSERGFVDQAVVARCQRRLLPVLFAVALSVYLLTRAPGLTWAHRGADGGDFLSAAATLGVPHPAGYPTYTLLLRLFMLLPVDEPAAAGNLLSVVMGAAAASLCGAIIFEVVDRLADSHTERSWAPWVAAAGALGLAFVPLVWSQALITEVYAFHLALVAAAFWAILRWRRTGRGLTWAGWLAGLGLTNHLTSVFLAPAFLAILVDGRKRLSWRALLAAGGAFCVGLAPYAYLPWAARRMPPINWENPQTWEGLRRLVLGARYRHNVLESTPAEVLKRVSGWLTDFPLTYFWPVYALIALGLLWLLLRDPPAGVMTGTYAVLVGGYATGYGTSDYWVILLPALMMLAVWLAVGIWLLLRWLERLWRPAPRIGLVAALAVPVALLITQWEAMDLSHDSEAREFVSGALETAAPDSLVFTHGDKLTFGMWYACYALDERPDLVPIIPTFLRSVWYRETLAANHQGLDLRPAGLGADALETMIKRHIRQRPIYLTHEDEDIAAGYYLVQEGPLWRVEPPGPGELP